MNRHDMVFSINRIENAPVTNCVLDYTGQVGVQRIMPKVCHIGSQPFGFIQQSLGHGLSSSTEVVEHGRQVRHTIPGHGGLPAKAEFFHDLIPGHTF